MEDIFITMAERIGVKRETAKRDPLVSTAVYLARLDMKEYVLEIIGPDDMSEAAQKLRAQLRRM